LKTVCQIGIQLVQAIEQIHELGYVYNDIRLENIIMASKLKKDVSSQIIIRDFNLITAYLDEEGNHINPESRDKFIGNAAMSSVHAMKFKTTSRRDDFISLCYILVLMIQGHLDFLNVD